MGGEKVYKNTLEQNHVNDWTPEQVVEFTLLPKIDQAFVKPLHWVEEELEFLEDPQQHKQIDSQVSHNTDSTLSNISVMDTS